MDKETVAMLTKGLTEEELANPQEDLLLPISQKLANGCFANGYFENP